MRGRFSRASRPDPHRACTLRTRTHVSVSTAVVLISTEPLSIRLLSPITLPRVSLKMLAHYNCFWLRPTHGFGPRAQALKSRSVSLQCHVTENIDFLRSSSANMHQPDIGHVDVDDPASRANSSELVALCLVGGPPCQPFSKLASGPRGPPTPARLLLMRSFGSGMPFPLW